MSETTREVTVRYGLLMPDGSIEAVYPGYLTGEDYQGKVARMAAERPGSIVVCRSIVTETTVTDWREAWLGTGT